MALTTYPLNNIDYTAEDAELYHCTRTSGVFASDEDFSATASGSDNNIVIGEGIAWIRNSRFSGKVVANKSAVSVDMGLADSTLNRIDAIVLQFDANRNQTDIIKKEGAPASSPVAPEVVRTESVYELHLYHVMRRAGATSIVQSDITDLRAISKYCGVMTDEVTILGDDFIRNDKIGVPDGVASLDSSGKVPSAQLPAMDYILNSQKGASNGVAPLSENKRVPIENLPVSSSPTYANHSTVATSYAVNEVSSSAKAALDLASSVERDLNDINTLLTKNLAYVVRVDFLGPTVRSQSYYEIDSLNPNFEFVGADAIMLDGFYSYPLPRIIDSDENYSGTVHMFFKRDSGTAGTVYIQNDTDYDFSRTMFTVSLRFSLV